MGIFCSALNANEYYGTSHCSSLDTIKIDFGQAQQVDERIATVLSTKTFGTQMNGSRFRDNSQKLDSLVLPFPRTYLKDTIECTVFATGRFLDNNNIKLNLKYFAVYQNNRIVENCEMILYRK